MPLQVKKVQLQLKDNQLYKDGDLLFNVDAEAWAKGTRNGQNVSSTDKTWQNNAKWFSEQAAQSAATANQVIFTGNLASQYDPTSSYKIGNYIMYNSTLYECIVTIPEGGDGQFNSEHWQRKMISDVKQQVDNIIVINQEAQPETKIKIETTEQDVDIALMEDIPDLTQIIAEQYSSSKIYNIGDYVFYQKKLYCCNTVITTPENWTLQHWTLVKLSEEILNLNKMLIEQNNIDFLSYELISYNISPSTGQWSSSSRYGSYLIPVPTNAQNITIVANENINSSFVLLANDKHSSGTTPSYATGQNLISLAAGTSLTINIPSDCTYIWISKTVDGETTNRLPNLAYFKIMKSFLDVDATLSVEGAAADAKTTGDTIINLEGNINNLKNNINTLVPINLAENVSITNGQYINYSNGETGRSNNAFYTDFIDISQYSEIIYSRYCSTSSSSNWGIFFYDENTDPISEPGIRAKLNNTEVHYEIDTADVPNNAKYVRLTGNQTVGPLELYGKEDYDKKVYPRLDKLDKEIPILEERTESYYSGNKYVDQQIINFDNGIANAQLETCVVKLPYTANGYNKIYIQRTGRNILGGKALLQHIIDTSNQGKVTFNESDNSVSFNHQAGNGVPTERVNNHRLKFKQDKQYVIILKTRVSNSDSTTTNLAVVNQGYAASMDPILRVVDDNINLQQIFHDSRLRVINIRTRYGATTSTTVYGDHSGVFQKDSNYIIPRPNLGQFTEIEEYKGHQYSYDWSDNSQLPIINNELNIRGIYGGYFNAITGELVETYNVNGEHIEPIKHYIKIDEIVTSLEGYNTIWCNVQGSLLTVTNKIGKSININNYVDVIKNDLDNKINNKQDSLIFDSEPIQGSLNPVTSGGILTYFNEIMGDEIATVVEDYLNHHQQLIVNIPDESLLSSKMSNQMKNWIRNGIINVKDYGAKGDGVTDDSQAIKMAINALPQSYGVLYFPPGLYMHGDGIKDLDYEQGQELAAIVQTTKTDWEHTGNGYVHSDDAQYINNEIVGTFYQYKPLISTDTHGIFRGVKNSQGSFIPGATVSSNYRNMGRDIRFIFSNKNNLTVLGNQAEIRSNDNNGECQHNEIFNFQNCSNVVIKNLTINGRRQQRGAWLGDSGGYNSRGNFCIRGCHNVLVENITSINSDMDGIAIGYSNDTYANFSTNILIKNCYFSGNHRQGISIVGAQGVTILDSIFSDTGLAGSAEIEKDGSIITRLYNGTNPKEGIDIEANSSNPLYQNANIIIKNCEFNNNRGIYSIQETGKCFGLVIESCVLRDKGIGISNLTGSNIYTRNVRIVNNILQLSRSEIQSSNPLTTPAIATLVGGIIEGNIIRYENPPSTKTNRNVRIIECRLPDTVQYKEPLLVRNNIIYMNFTENFNPTYTKYNAGVYINNPYTIFENNVFHNPLWGAVSDNNPINFVSILQNKNNIFMQEIIPNSYNEIPSRQDGNIWITGTPSGGGGDDDQPEEPDQE